MAIKLLSNLCQKILDVKARKQFYLEEMMNNLSYETFLESDWQKVNHFEEY